MPLSNSVLHRYTPPTCTLQVVAYSSPVSRWVGSKVVNQVQFDLRFDDPRSPAEKQFSITGDRNQLEDLHTVVTNYIQELLSLSPESFADLGKETPPASVPPSPLVDVEGDVWLMPTNDLPPATPEVSHEAAVPPAPVATLAQGEFFALKPATKLSHNLFLGSLATRETGQFIQLSVLQLFDLATALDEYATELVALPTYRNNVQTSAPLAWANIAAVLLLGVGVTAVGLQVFNRPNSLQTANNVNNRPKTRSTQAGVAPKPFPTLSPAQTLVPPPNSNIISSNSATTTISVPNKAAVGQIVTPGKAQQSQSNPVPNGLPPQPIVINPNTGQSSTTITIPQPASTPTPPSTFTPNPNLEASTSSITIKNVPVAQPDNNSPRPENEPPTKQNRSPSTPTRTAFVTNPQVVEVSNYFNQRWEPPSSLRSALEYSIILDVDGSIQVIEPYGIASRTYLDRTGMPLIGERFVSANQNGQSPRIRLRFNPNGKVQAFLESGDAR